MIRLGGRSAIYLNLGTTFHMTENRDSGDIAAFSRCHRATNVLRSSSTRKLGNEKLTVLHYFDKSSIQLIFLLPTMFSV